MTDLAALISFCKARADDRERDALDLPAEMDLYVMRVAGRITRKREAAFARQASREQALRDVQFRRTLIRYLLTADGMRPVSLLISETAEQLGRGGGFALPAEWILRELATVDSEDPDYRPEWKP